MRPELEVGRHRLNMDGKWDLLELSSFGRQYVQVYSILYALHFGADKDDPDDRTHHAFRAFPWRGGWSAVGFYESLRSGHTTKPPTARYCYRVRIAWIY